MILGGIGDMILVIALLFFALWKEGWIRIILSLCIIIWGVFFMSYDMKIAAPLLTIGIVLFITSTLRLIKNYRSQETT
jgi:hypothetical protein